MGGRGSGRHWHYSAKDTTDDYRSIDVRHWQREGLLTPGHIFTSQWLRGGEITASIQVVIESDRIILSYRHQPIGGEWQDKRYAVLLDWTPYRYGGKRAWLRCPAVGCGRRVAILYGSGVFACRHCYQLAYPSQREANYDRLARKADEIREKLGWEPGILNSGGLKPKGMHWQTFERLVAEHDALVDQFLAGIARKFETKPEYLFRLI